jgi:hypothetical protein
MPAGAAAYDQERLIRLMNGAKIVRIWRSLQPGHGIGVPAVAGERPQTG